MCSLPERVSEAACKMPCCGCCSVQHLHHLGTQSSTLLMQQLSHSYCLQVEAQELLRQVQQLRTLRPSPSRPLQQPWPRLQTVSNGVELGTAKCNCDGTTAVIDPALFKEVSPNLG